jgi:hypothetical protein
MGINPEDGQIDVHDRRAVKDDFILILKVDSQSFASKFGLCGVDIVPAKGGFDATRTNSSSLAFGVLSIVFD